MSYLFPSVCRNWGSGVACSLLLVMGVAPVVRAEPSEGLQPVRHAIQVDDSSIAPSLHGSDRAGSDVTTVAEVDGEAVLRAVLKIGVSQGLLDAARKNDKGEFGDAVLIGLLTVARDEAVLSAMHDLFPNNTETDCSAARRLLCLCMDGKLTADNWRDAQSRDAIMKRLRDADPNMANSAEVADFISHVVDHYQRGRQSN